MFRKILLAVDSSPAKEIVAACAGNLGKLGSKEALIVQCFQIPEQVAFPSEIEESIRVSLVSIQENLKNQGFLIRVVVEAGLPALEIPNLADKENCSLIVVGAKGHNFSSELFLGGTASELLHRVSRPLLIIRIAKDLKTGKTGVEEASCDFMRHVLFPTDFSVHAEAAFKYLLEIAGKGAEHITLLHTQDLRRWKKHIDPRLDEYDEIDKQRLDELKTRLEAVGSLTISVKLSHGNPIEEILKEEQQASLIVMGTHGRGYISEIFMGSVSHNIARHSSAPVLLVPNHFKKQLNK
jgi:nucleotide-binding universal stress UspA family protein